MNENSMISVSTVVGIKSRVSRACCHSCGNLRKKQVQCQVCPYVFCARCINKQIEMHGENVFDSHGCPVCKKLCCCSDKNRNCQKKYHCYKKCEIYKTKPHSNNLCGENRNLKRSRLAGSTNGPLFVSPHLIPNTPTRTETSLLVKPPFPEQASRQSQHLLPLSIVMKNLHRLPPWLPPKPLLSSISTNSAASTMDYSQLSQCSHDSKSWGSGLSNCDQNSQPFSQSVFEKSLTNKLSSPSSRTGANTYGSINTLAEALEILNAQQDQTWFS